MWTGFRFRSNPRVQGCQDVKMGNIYVALKNGPRCFGNFGSLLKDYLKKLKSRYLSRWWLVTTVVEQKHNLLDVRCTLLRWKYYHWSPKPHNLSRHLAILWSSEGWHLNLGPRLDENEVNPESRPIRASFFHTLRIHCIRVSDVFVF